MHRLMRNSYWSITESITYEQIKFFLEENREAALNIIEKATKSMEARDAARKASYVRKDNSANHLQQRKNLYRV